MYCIIQPNIHFINTVANGSSQKATKYYKAIHNTVILLELYNLTAFDIFAILILKTSKLSL